eukprot:754887-Hanusia_phi.AAC.1
MVAHRANARIFHSWLLFVSSLRTVTRRIDDQKCLASFFSLKKVIQNWKTWSKDRIHFLNSHSVLSARRLRLNRKQIFLQVWKAFCKVNQCLSSSAEILFRFKINTDRVFTLSDWFLNHVNLKQGKSKQLRFQKQSTTQLTEEVRAEDDSCKPDPSGGIIASQPCQIVRKSETDVNPRNAAVERVMKFIYDHEGDSWKSVEQHILFASRPLSRGMRFESYMTWEVDDNYNFNNSIFISKIPIPLGPKSSPVLASDYANMLHKQGVEPKLEFLHMGVLKLLDRDGLLINYEQFVPTLDEESEPSSPADSDDLIHAFMHFTWKASNRRFLVSSVKTNGKRQRTSCNQVQPFCVDILLPPSQGTTHRASIGAQALSSHPSDESPDITALSRAQSRQTTRRPRSCLTHLGKLQLHDQLEHARRPPACHELAAWAEATEAAAAASRRWD